MKTKMMKGVGASLALALLAGSPVLAQTLPADQWPSYGQNSGSTNFSPLDQITPANVATLQRAWTFNYGGGTDEQGDRGLSFRWEVTPLIIGGVMYVSTPSNPALPELKSTITALEPETGRVIWKYESDRNIHGRGLAYWPGDGDVGPRLFFATEQGYLRALDMATGQLAAGFGEQGEIDAYVGVASELVGETRRDTWTIPNPASVYRNLVITGSRPGEAGPPGPRGDIRAWDARSGALVWTFHTIPKPGEFGYETWLNNSADTTGNAGVWTQVSIDPELNLAYRFRLFFSIF